MNRKHLSIESIIAAILIYMLTFPSLEPDYSIGLDSSYAWAFNYLFNNNYHILKGIIYPYGPLAFLKIPTIEGYNFEYYLLFYSFIKLWFIFMFIYLSARAKSGSQILTYIAVTIILLLADIDYLIIGISFIHCFLFLQDNRFSNIAFATSLAFIGICIKSSIGVSAFSMLIVTFVIYLYNNRNFFAALKFLSIVILAVLFWGLLVFQSIGFLKSYILGVLKLAFSYSSSLSLFVPNNWGLLFLFWISVLFPPFIEKNKKLRISFLLLLPVLFAMWKHAITREDFLHASILLSFLFLYWGILIIFSETKKKQLLLLAVLSITLYYSNMTNIWNFKARRVDINGINNFKNIVLDFKNFKEKNRQASEESVHANALDSGIIKLVKNATIDSYPWELSYFSANNLNWKPRRTLQSWSFAKWLDVINAQDLDRSNGPQYIILHTSKDMWNGDFGSLDEGYLLNDNPFAIISIFNFYSIKFRSSDYLLLEKNSKDNFIKVSIEKPLKTKWNEWINVDVKNAEVLRLKLFSEASLIGKIKNFLYKSEIYYADYMLEDGKVLTYRYIPENARDGIWVSPLVRFPYSAYQETPVAKMRFRCTNSLFNKSALEYQFERILIDTLRYPTNDSINSVNYLFLKTRSGRDKIVFKSFNDFDKIEYNKQSGINVSDKFFYSGINSNHIIPNGYSYTIKIDLDSLWATIDTTFKRMVIESDLKYLNLNSEASHVIALSNSSKDFWKANALKKNQQADIWNYSYQSSEITRREYHSGVMSIYVWNSGKNDLFIEDMRVTIKATKDGN